MAVYAVGDVQGCCEELQRLLDALNFDPGADRLWLVGDLVNRGPASLETLRLVHALGDSAITVLGNHDLHLLALALVGNASSANDGLLQILNATDCDELIDWLRNRPLVHYDPSLQTLMVHAGIAAQWSRETALKRAAEVEAVLRGDIPEVFLKQMYGAQPDYWSPELEGTERLRFIVNSCTRMRYYSTDGKLNLNAKLAPAHYSDSENDKLIPWFRYPNRKTLETRIVFGHWSALGYVDEANVRGLDTGCVWGGKLTAIRLDEEAPPVQIDSQQPKRF